LGFLTGLCKNGVYFLLKMRLSNRIRIRALRRCFQVIVLLPGLPQSIDSRGKGSAGKIIQNCLNCFKGVSREKDGGKDMELALVSDTKAKSAVLGRV